MGVPLNHPFINRIFHEINQVKNQPFDPAIGDPPLIWVNDSISLT